MAIDARCASIWPKVTFTGGSSIHASIAKDGRYPASARQMFALLYEKKFATDIWRFLNHKFPQVEWLLNQTQFEDRAYVDFYNHAIGTGDSQEPSKLRNPSTGNVFHRVALYQDQGLVAGIRFWCDAVGYGDERLTDVGFRFRIEGMHEDEDEVRLRVQEQALADREKLTEVIEVELSTQPDDYALTEEEKERVKLIELE